MSPAVSKIYGLILLAFFEISVFEPRFFWILILLSLIITFLFTWLIEKKRWSQSLVDYSISPLLFVLGSWLFVGFTDSRVAVHVIIIFTSLANTLFFYHLTTLLHRRHRYQEHSLSNISKIINIASIFFLMVSFFNLVNFLKLPMAVLTMLTGIVVWLVTYQFFCINKLKNNNHHIYISVITITLIELFYLISWLPLMSLVKGALLVSAYYSFIGIVQNFLSAKLNKKNYRLYIIILIIVWLLLLSTARWQ